MKQRNLWDRRDSGIPLITWSEGWLPVTFVVEGQDVYVPFPFDSPKAVLCCTVAAAAGKDFRIVNEKHHVDTWVSLDDVRVPDAKKLEEISRRNGK